MPIEQLPFLDIADIFSVNGAPADLQESLVALGILLIVAKLFEGVARRFGVNSIVAYATAGILLGPVMNLSGTWSISSSLDIELLLLLGVSISFFLMGLDEIEIPRFFASLRKHYFFAAVLSVILSVGISMLVTTDLVFDFGLQLAFTESLALAGILSMTNFGIVVKVLFDDGRLKEPVGMQIFTVVIIAEMLVLLLIAFSIGEHAAEASLTGSLLLLAKVAGFVVVSWILSSRVLPPAVSLLQRVLPVPQLSLGLLLGFLFLMVWGAERIGLHGSLGALLFGASLSGLSYQVRREITPGLRSVAEGLFVPLFFASAGLHFSFSFVSLPVWTMVALAAIPLLGNFVGAFIGAYLSRLTVPYAVASGLMAKGVAEIALLLVMWNAGIINEVIFSFLVLVMFCYILFMPPVISFAVGRASRRADQLEVIPENPFVIIPFALDDILVDHILDRSRRHPDSEISVREFINRWALANQNDYVVTSYGALVGIVSLTTFRYLPRGAWNQTSLGEVLVRETPLAWPDEHVVDLIHRMNETGLSVLPVVERESEKLIGSVTQADIVELMVTDYQGGHL